MFSPKYMMISYKSQNLTNLSPFPSDSSSVYDMRTYPLIILLIYTDFTPIIQNGKSKQKPCG